MNVQPNENAGKLWVVWYAEKDGEQKRFAHYLGCTIGEPKLMLHLWNSVNHATQWHRGFDHPGGCFIPNREKEGWVVVKREVHLALENGEHKVLGDWKLLQDLQDEWDALDEARPRTPGEEG